MEDEKMQTYTEHTLNRHDTFWLDQLQQNTLILLKQTWNKVFFPTLPGEIQKLSALVLQYLCWKLFWFYVDLVFQKEKKNHTTP